MVDRACAAVWADATGLTRMTVVKAATNPCSILAALVGVSQAQIQYNWDGTIDGSLGAVSSGTYQSVAQSATLMFTTVSGSILTLTVPAPSLGGFLPDKVTIDPVPYASLIATCIGNLSDGAGNIATAFIGGHLNKTRTDLTPIGV